VTVSCNRSALIRIDAGVDCDAAVLAIVAMALRINTDERVLILSRNARDHEEERSDTNVSHGQQF
jgi:hypothetical protein